MCCSHHLRELGILMRVAQAPSIPMLPGADHIAMASRHLGVFIENSKVFLQDMSTFDECAMASGHFVPFKPRKKQGLTTKSRTAHFSLALQRWHSKQQPSEHHSPNANRGINQETRQAPSCIRWSENISTNSFLTQKKTTRNLFQGTSRENLKSTCLVEIQPRVLLVFDVLRAAMNTSFLGPAS